MRRLRLDLMVVVATLIHGFAFFAFDFAFAIVGALALVAAYPGSRRGRDGGLSAGT